MIQILVFDNLDPWQSDYRRDSRGRFAGGGGGGGSSTRRAISPGRKGRWGSHTQRVTGYTAQGKRKTASVTSTTRSLRAGKGKRTTAYAYKVGKYGRVSKNPSKMTTRMITSANRRYRPGTPVGSKNVRYLSQGHAAARFLSAPGSNARILGRLHSKSVIARAKRGRPLSRGYVVSYGKPLSRRRP